MIDTLASIWLLHTAAMVLPGPNVLLVSQMAARGHLRAARLAALGIVLGSGLWAAAAALGMHALLALFPAVHGTLQIVGAFYLLHLARGMWSAAAPASVEAPPAIPSRTIHQGLLTSFTNPKAAFFYGSVFASALPPAPPPALQVGAVALVLGNALCWYMALAYLCSRPRITRAYRRGERLAGRCGALCFAGFGGALLFAAWRGR